MYRVLYNEFIGMAEMQCQLAVLLGVESISFSSFEARMLSDGFMLSVNALAFLGTLKLRLKCIGGRGSTMI